MPSRYYAGTFVLDDRLLSLPTARGCPPLALRLSRSVPYAQGTVRSVTLVNVGPKLFVDVTAELPIAIDEAEMGPDPARVAGVDLGIIHPYAVVAEEVALVVSGRDLRAENRLHLAEKRALSRALATRAPQRGQAGSRRWRKYRARTRRLEERHWRRVAQATHEAARAVVDFALKERIGTLVVGDPRSLLKKDVGKRQNLAVRNWRPGQMISALTDKAALAGIVVELIDERGTSSTCPRCGAKVRKPKGRRFHRGFCTLVAHRDLVGAANIARRHRRAGRHLPGRPRRDPRRISMDKHRRERVDPWPAVAHPETIGESLDLVAPAA
jgi:IS605 OrfB family transposase